MRKCVERIEEREGPEELLRHPEESCLPLVTVAGRGRDMVPSEMWGQAFHALKGLLLASRIHCITPVLLIDRHYRADQYYFSYDFCLNEAKNVMSIFSCIGTPHQEDTKYINSHLVPIKILCLS